MANDVKADRNRAAKNSFLFLAKATRTESNKIFHIVKAFLYTCIMYIYTVSQKKLCKILSVNFLSILIVFGR